MVFKMSDRFKLSLVIPMYNESSIARKSAEEYYKAVSKICSKHNWNFEIIFSNDGSTDNCGEIIEKYSEEISCEDLKVIGYFDNRGKGSAVREGVLASSGDAVIYTDCDIAYGTDVIETAALSILDGNDIVIGSRNLSADGYEGYTLIRKLASKIYIKVLCVAAGFNLSDSQCGFKAFKKEAGHRVFSLCKTNGFAFDFEAMMIAEHLGYKVKEMPVKIINHRESTVHLFSDSIKMIKQLMNIKKYVRNLKKTDLSLNNADK